MIALLLALGTLAPWPHVDQGCPAEPAIVASDDYHRGVWTHADGTVFGLAPHEDDCILPVTIVR